LERTEKRLAIVEAAQEHNLEPKIEFLEDKIQKVQHHEHELHELIRTNSTRLDQIDVQCHKVNKWMLALANPAGGDVFDEAEDDAEEKAAEHAKEHHHHHHHTPSAES